MRVKIGPYRSWIGPYQIADALCWWAKPVRDKHGFESKPEWVHSFGSWLNGGKLGESLLLKLCNWLDGKRTRQVYVKINSYDTWSMDHTLAHIVLPMLRQLLLAKHGAPYTEDADVPEHLKSSQAAPKKYECDTDSNHFARWDWIMLEMIWAFEQKLDDNWQAKYYSGKHDTTLEPSHWDETGKPTLYTMVEGRNHTHKCDYDGLAKEQARITNGFRLFGKYYEGLWD